MIKLTKEQLADLLRESFALGAIARGGREQLWVATESFHDARERAIQPLVHRSSGGHDDHGLEVPEQPLSPSLVLPTPEQVMHVVMKFQWEDRKNGTGTTNWAANLGMTVVEYVARLNAGRRREVE